MKKGSNQRGRSRGRNNNNINSNNNFVKKVNYNINTCFDSNGPGGRIRGSVQQVVDKYLLMARDANSQNDRVLAENCYQYAEHYNRIINSFPPPVRQVEEKQEVVIAEGVEEETKITTGVSENTELLCEPTLMSDKPIEPIKSENKRPKRRPHNNKPSKELPEDMIKGIGFLSKELPLTTTAE